MTTSLPQRRGVGVSQSHSLSDISNASYSGWDDEEKEHRRPWTRWVFHAFVVMQAALVVLLLAITMLDFRAGKTLSPGDQPSPPLAAQPQQQMQQRAGKAPPSALHIGRRSHALEEGGASTGANFCDEVDFALADDVVIAGGAASSSPDAIPLRANLTVSGVVEIGEYHYYQVCVATHPTHHHSIEFTLNCDGAQETSAPVLQQQQQQQQQQQKQQHQHHHQHRSAVPDLYYNADLLVSADSNPMPTREAGATWMSLDRGSDFVAIPTYVEDFAAAPATASGRGKILHVGVYGHEVKVHGIRVLSLPEREKLKLKRLGGSGGDSGDGPEAAARGDRRAAIQQEVALGTSDGPTGIAYSLSVVIRNIPEKKVDRRSGSLRGKAAIMGV